MKTYRVKEWWYLLGILLLSYFYNLELDFFSLVYSLIATTFLLAFAYSWNELYDKDHKLKFAWAPLFPFLLTIFSIFFFKSYLHKIVYTSLLIIVFFYSSPKIALKQIPLISTLCNTIAPPMLLFLGIQEIDTDIKKFFLVLTALFFVAQILHELADYKKDREKNITTIEIIGEKNYIILGIGILIISLSTFFWDFIIFLGLIIMFISFLANLTYARKRNLSYNFLREKYRKTGLLVGLFWLIYFIFRDYH